MFVKFRLNFVFLLIVLVDLSAFSLVMVGAVRSFPSWNLSDASLFMLCLFCMSLMYFMLTVVRDTVENFCDRLIFSSRKDK